MWSLVTVFKFAKKRLKTGKCVKFYVAYDKKIPHINFVQNCQDCCTNFPENGIKGGGSP